MNDAPRSARKITGPVLIACLVAWGASSRLDGFGRIGLDHFDEGIYASASTWSLRPGGLDSLDPGLIPYAPPGYPILVGLAYILLGPTDSVAVAVSILAGLAAIPLVARMAGDWTGRAAGLAAATFAALSFVPIAFSRMALTDATFLLAWCLALWLGGRFLGRPGPSRAIPFGVAVGLAQMVKYNGWISGVIVAVAALLGLVIDPVQRERSRLFRLFGWGLVAAFLAALMVWPWFRFVEGHGGYGALLRHQRGYLGGLDSWPEHWSIQLRQSTALDGPGLAGYMIAAIAILVAPCGASGWPRGLDKSPGTWFACSALGGLILMPATSGWWLGLALAPRFLLDREPGHRLLGAWWVVLSVLTPFYHPYARLWLPLEAAGWLVKAAAIGALAEAILGPTSSEFPERLWARKGLIASVGIALVLAWLLPDLASRRARPLEPAIGPRDSFRTATARIIDQVPPGARSVRVLARPVFLFYGAGRLAGRGVALSRVGSLDDLLRAPEGYAIVDMAQLRQEGDVAAARARLLNAWDVIGEQETILSNVTLLDVDPSAAFGDLSARSEPLLLLRTKKGAPKP